MKGVMHHASLYPREDLAMACQEEMYEWLDAQDSACVAIFDATNTTKARRAALLERAKRAEGVSLIFLESICDDERILASNYRMKLANADYSAQVSKQFFHLKLVAGPGIRLERLHEAR
jgi:hypothetical protein